MSKIPYSEGTSGGGKLYDGVRIVQVEVGYRPWLFGPPVTDDQGVHQPETNTVYVTEKNYEAIRTSARDMGQVTYTRG